MFDLRPIVLPILNEYAQKICERVEQEWSNRTISIPGRKEIHTNFPEIVMNVLMVEIIASGQAAWIAEYGSGSLMTTTQNPWLAEYISSSEFNDLRTLNSLAITGREEGDYKDLDGNIKHSTGKAKKLNLEYGLHGRNPYIPHEAMFIIEKQIDFAIPEIQKAIGEACEEYIFQQLKNSLPKEVFL